MDAVVITGGEPLLQKDSPVENDFHSIAFPAISTGVYGYPIEKAADVAMKEVVEFMYFHPEYDMEVTVAAFGYRTKMVYENALKKWRK